MLIVGDVFANSCHYRRRAFAEDQTCRGFGRGVTILGDHQLYLGHCVRSARNDLHHSMADELVDFDCEPNKE